MLKFGVKFIFYPILIVMLGMYYFISYLTIAITAIVSSIAICKATIKENKKNTNKVQVN